MYKPFWIDPANKKATLANPRCLDVEIAKREVLWETTHPHITTSTVILHRIQGATPKEHLHRHITCHSLPRPAGTQPPPATAVTVELASLFDGTQPLCKCVGTQALIFITRDNVPAVKAAYLLALVENDLKGAARKTRSAAGRHASLKCLTNANLILAEVDKIAGLPEFAAAAYDNNISVAADLAPRLAEGNQHALADDRDKTELKIRFELGVGNSELDDTEVVVMMATSTLRPTKLGEIAIGNYTIESRTDARMMRCPLWVWSWLAGRPLSHGRVAAASVAVLDDSITADDLRIAWHLYDPDRDGRLNTARAALSSAVLLRPAHT